MTTESGGEAAVVETTPTPAPEAGFSSQEPAQQQSNERDYESEARDMGWRPQDEWTGKPEHWKDAKTYVEFDVVANRLTKAEREFNERLAKIEKANSRTIEKLQAQHAKEVAELAATRREAIKSGDVDAVEALDQQIADLKADAPDKAPARTDEQVQAEWMAKNTWYETDEDLATVALGYSNKIKSPDLSLEENLKRTEEYVRKKFPEKFGAATKAANGHAAVDGGGMAPGALKTDPLAKLPSEARQQAKSDMAKFPKIYPTAEAWIKAYNS